MVAILNEKTINYNGERQRLVITKNGRRNIFYGKLALLMLKFEQKKDSSYKPSKDNKNENL